MALLNANHYIKRNMLNPISCINLNQTLGSKLNKVIFIMVAFFSISQSWASENLRCSSGKDQFTDTLSLEVENEKVLGFKYFTTAGAYSCDVSAHRGDEDTNWSNQGKITTIKFNEGSTIIEQKGNTYLVRFVDLSHIYHCGMNGQLAKQVLISRNNNKCIIR